MLPQLIATDIDGCWTDGGMYYSESGDEFKKFNTSDSAGVRFAQLLKIPVAIITQEKSEAVKRRAQKLNISLCYTGVTDKLGVAHEICSTLGIGLSGLAYLGDDLNDIAVIRAAGYSACPATAPDYIKALVTKVLTKKGGEGAFREFVEDILRSNGVLDNLLQQHFINI